MRKCGLITFHNSHNYGSVLQTYAMVKTLKLFELHVDVINYRSPYTTAAFETHLWSPYKTLKLNVEDFILQYILGFGRKREKAFNHFIQNNFPLTQAYTSEKEIPPIYDILICGSDQIWNPVASGKAAPVYFLAFGRDDCIRFSYAASSGSTKFAEGRLEELLSYLSKFKCIGVRETFMQDYIGHTFKMNSCVNPDPTILLPKEEWEKIESSIHGLPENYLLVYSLAKIDEVLDFAKQIASQLKLPLVHINPDRRLGYLKHKYVDYNLNEVAPEQFLWLFHHASFIVTNTFHGNMFSVIYRKDFINYTPNKQDTRILTLHNQIGLNNSRLLSDISQFHKNMVSISYTSIEERIQAYRNSGLEYIKQAISE